MMNKRLERLEEELGNMKSREEDSHIPSEWETLGQSNPELYEAYTRVFAEVLRSECPELTEKQSEEVARHWQGETPCPPWAKGTGHESLGEEADLLRWGFKTLPDGTLVSVPKKTQKVDQK